MRMMMIMRLSLSRNEKDVYFFARGRRWKYYVITRTLIHFMHVDLYSSADYAGGENFTISWEVIRK